MKRHIMVTHMKLDRKLHTRNIRNLKCLKCFVEVGLLHGKLTLLIASTPGLKRKNAFLRAYYCMTYSSQIFRRLKVRHVTNTNPCKRNELHKPCKIDDYCMQEAQINTLQAQKPDYLACIPKHSKAAAAAAEIHLYEGFDRVGDKGLCCFLRHGRVQPGEQLLQMLYRIPHGHRQRPTFRQEIYLFVEPGSEVSGQNLVLRRPIVSYKLRSRVDVQLKTTRITNHCPGKLVFRTSE
eukprot:scaffold74039_cov23-Prasinocladus_malaysianus.AAC.1